MPCDDSVPRVVPDDAGGTELSLRRSRGYAPLPIEVNLDARQAPGILAVGGELKNTFCLTDGVRAYLSGHIGDMATWETLRAFERAVGQLSEIRGTQTRIRRRPAPGVSHPKLGGTTWRRSAAGPDPAPPRHTSCRCWPHMGASENPSSASPSTAPATDAITRSGAARFWCSDRTATASCGRPILRPVPLPGDDARRSAIPGGRRCPSYRWPVSTGRRASRRSRRQPPTNYV